MWLKTQFKYYLDPPSQDLTSSSSANRLVIPFIHLYSGDFHGPPFKFVHVTLFNETINS